MQEDVFDDTEKMLGTVPFILRVMAEILDAILIAAVIGQTRVLAESLRAFQEFEEGDAKEGR